MKGLNNLQRFSFNSESVLWSEEDAHLKCVALGTENVNKYITVNIFFL